MTPVITACMPRTWKVEVCQKKRNTTSQCGRRYQSAISSKEHIMYEASQTYLSVTYQHDRLHLGRQKIAASESGTTATTKHAIFQRVFSGKINTKRVRCDTGRMHATYWFLPWIVSTFTTAFAWRSLTTRGTIIFPRIFCVEHVRYTLAPCHKICHRQKAYCV